MLGENNIRNSIKDLFDAERILYCFDIVEFTAESFILALKTILKDYSQSTVYKIYIDTDEDYENILSLLSRTRLSQKLSIIICIQSDIIKHIPTFVDGVKYYVDEVPHKTVDELFEINAEWFKNNPLYITYKLNHSNYVEQINAMIENAVAKGYRFIDIEWDYESFADMEILELDKLEFWVKHLQTWVKISHEKNNIRVVINGSNSIIKKVYYDVDGCLYLNRNKNYRLIDVNSNIGKTGEDIPYKQLSRVRQLIDLKVGDLYFPFGTSKLMNLSLIDFDANISIEGFINSVPYITNIIMRFLSNV